MLTDQAGPAGYLMATLHLLTIGLTWPWAAKTVKPEPTTGQVIGRAIGDAIGVIAGDAIDAVLPVLAQVAAALSHALDMLLAGDLFRYDVLILVHSIVAVAYVAYSGRIVWREARDLALLYLTIIFLLPRSVPALLLWDIACFAYLRSQFKIWQDEFATRYPRHHASCPSHKLPPKLGHRLNEEWLHRKGKAMWGFTIRQLSRKHLGFATQDGLGELKQQLRESSGMQLDEDSSARDGNTKPSILHCPAKISKNPKMAGIEAPRLDMNHVYLTWTQFIWGRTFVTLPFYFTYVFGGEESEGLLRLLLRTFAFRHGFGGLECPKRNMRSIFAELLVESSMAAHVTKVVHDDNGGIVGHFRIEDAAILGGKGTKNELAKWGVFEATVDLKARLLVQATFDGEEMTPEDAFCVLSSEASNHIHPQLHAYANWGVCHDYDGVHSYLRRASIVTVIYNDMGFRGGATGVELLHSLGVCKHATGPGFKSIVNGVRSGMADHKHVHDLMPYSKYVSFVVKVRRFFLHHFENYKNDFGAHVSGEAVFIGSLFHSIDHSQFNYLHCAADYVSVDKDKTAALAEVGRAVVSSLSGKVRIAPWLLGMTARTSQHPLFRETYQFAKRIDLRMANNMECCILK